jgi:beta-1,4-mannosyltransferase
MRTAVIVIGDLGRSPRMQYHAASLADAGSDVDLIGLDGAEVIPAVAANPRIHVHRLADRGFAGRAKGGVRRFVFGSAMRGIGQGIALFRALMRIPKPDTILVQNPPAIPTLSVAWLASRLRGARFVIDWHNLSHTIAAVKVGDRHRAVKAIARSERRWAKRADAHLTVSKGLAEWLAREYRINPTVVYDRPGAAFTTPSADDAAELWNRIAAETNLGVTRPPIVVCPTSWTPDEDFDLVLEALERTERQLKRDDEPKGSSPRIPGAGGDKPSGLSSPALVVFLTGRGALRGTFEARAARRNFKAIAVRTLWLEPADYPKLIGIADLGLCLHQSSSGLDLPMKLADLFGCGVPVAAFDYAPVLGEVMTTGQHGVTFNDPGALSTVLLSVAKGSIAPDSALAKSRTWLAHNAPQRWDTQWTAMARPVLLP